MVMKYIVFIIIFFTSNLSHSYENNQLLLHNQPKKVDFIFLNTLDGEKTNIFKKYNKKKIFLINFWATWCPPCIKEIPELIKLEEKYNKDLKVIFISVDSNPKKVIPNFLKKQNFKKFSSFVDNKLEITKSLNVKVMPTTLMINNQLEEISRVEGYIDWLNKKVENMFKELL